MRGVASRSACEALKRGGGRRPKSAVGGSPPALERYFRVTERPRDDRQPASPPGPAPLLNVHNQVDRYRRPRLGRPGHAGGPIAGVHEEGEGSSSISHTPFDSTTDRLPPARPGEVWGRVFPGKTAGAPTRKRSLDQREQGSHENVRREQKRGVGRMRDQWGGGGYGKNLRGPGRVPQINGGVGRGARRGYWVGNKDP